MRPRPRTAARRPLIADAVVPTATPAPESAGVLLLRDRQLGGLWSRQSLAVRLLALQGAVLLLAMGMVLIVVSRAFDSRSQHQVDSELAADAKEFTAAANVRPLNQNLGAFATQYLRQLPLEVGTFLVVHVNGTAAVGSTGSQVLEQNARILSWLARPPAQSVIGGLEAGGGSFRVLASPIAVRGAVSGVLIVATDLAHVTNQTRDVLLLTAAEVSAAVVVAMLTSFLVLRRVLGIVAKVTETADRISREGPGHRLQEPSTDDEIGQLVHTFNEMLARLEAAFESQRRLLADVSHQMRTPLTVMRGHLEVTRRGGLADPVVTGETIDLVLDELEHTTALVDRMLVLGRSMDPDFIQPEPVDLRSFLGDVMTAAQPLADRCWVLGSVPDLVMLIDRDRLRGALLNLLDNAVKATLPDDTIRLESERTATGVTVAVADTGRGIAPDLQERIFQRFERGDRAEQRGSGLGLAIVKAVTEAHGGSVAVRSAPGQGCTVRLVLPDSRILVPKAWTEREPG
ncbi:MAG: sensor histidine kinase [Candidatus Dormibacteria bacterium]